MYDSFSVSMNLDWDQFLKSKFQEEVHFRKVQHLV